MDCPNPKRRSAVVAGLPDDLLVDILARVPARSLCRSKCIPLHRKRLPQTLHGFFFVDEKIHGRRPIEFASLQRESRSAPLQIDTSLSFLTKRPGIETLTFSDCCNGLLLFENKQKSRPFDLLSYVVCNPATEQWVVVPRHGPPALAHVREEATRYDYLVFDPSVSSHFHLVHFGWESKESMEFEGGFAFDDDDDDDGVHLVHFHNIEEGEMYRTTLHVYSSVTGKWTRMQSGWSQIQSEWGWGEHNLEGWHHQGLVPYQRSRCAVLNGMLHFVTSDHRIAAVDVQEATEKIIPLPALPEKKSWPEPGYVAQSQGKLH
nr:unnamed protein product [Digitaria exilis]